MLFFFYIYIFFYKVVALVSEGSVFNVATLSSLSMCSIWFVMMTSQVKSEGQLKCHVQVQVAHNTMQKFVNACKSVHIHVKVSQSMLKYVKNK